MKLPIEKGGPGSGRKKVGIQDMKKKEVLRGMNGTEDIVLNRYGVWFKDKGEKGHNIIETHDDLDYLKEKYDVESIFDRNGKTI